MKKHYFLLSILLTSAIGFAQAQCVVDFYSINNPGTLTVQFRDTSSTGPSQNSYFWNFGDGSALSFQQNPVHTYNAPGTYTVQLLLIDSLCYDSIAKQVTVPTSLPGNCTASFTKAKDTSTAFGVLLTNTSSSSSTTAYTWYFGDGNSATGATPTHTYQNFGSYNVCLVVYDSLSNCVNTFCDTVGLDSNGNLKSNGFSLTVVLPNVTSLDENTLENAVSIFPNPTADQIALDLSQIDSAVDIRLFNLSGQEVLEYSRIANQSNLIIDLSDHPSGIYFLQVEDGNQRTVKKVIKH